MKKNKVAIAALISGILMGGVFAIRGSTDATPKCPPGTTLVCSGGHCYCTGPN